jgi:hypothetical protein
MAKKYVRVVVARQITIEAKRLCQDVKCAGSVPARWLPECRAWGLYPILVGCSFQSDGAFHSARARSSLPGLGGLTLRFCYRFDFLATRGPAKVAEMVEVLDGLTARYALCLLVGCILTVLDEAPSDEGPQQSLEGCIDLLK